MKSNLVPKEKKNKIEELKQQEEYDGFYSTKVRGLTRFVLLMTIFTLILDAVRLYFSAKAVEQDLTKRFGVEYTFWKMITHDGYEQVDAQKELGIHNMTK